MTCLLASEERHGSPSVEAEHGTKWRDRDDGRQLFVAESLKISEL